MSPKDSDAVWPTLLQSPDLGLSRVLRPSRCVAGAPSPHQRSLVPSPHASLGAFDGEYGDAQKHREGLPPRPRVHLPPTPPPQNAGVVRLQRKDDNSASHSMCSDWKQEFRPRTRGVARGAGEGEGEKELRALQNMLTVPSLSQTEGWVRP